MKVVFFGSPRAAIPSLIKILQEGHNVGLVVTQPDRRSGRGKKLGPPPIKTLALEHRIPLIQPQNIRKDPAVLDELKSTQPDINVVVAYGQIIPPAVIYFPPGNSINLHFSLLPRYRGASPVQWAILNGEKTTGLTVFTLNEKMDEGDILTQQKVDILSGESANRLEDRLAEKGAELLAATLNRIKEIEPRPQDHSRATYAPRIRKEDGLLDWSRGADFIERQIRAFTPWPSSYTYLGGKRIKILSGQYESAQNLPFQPGEIAKAEKSGIHVMCGDGNIFRIELLQPENKAKMSAYSFSLGANIQSGTAFEMPDPSRIIHKSR